MNEQQFRRLPEDQRISAQKRLIELGIYVGKPDGKWGEGTKAAFELEAKKAADDAKAARAGEERARQDKLRGEEIEVEKLKAQSGKTVADADAKKKEEEAKAAAVE